MRRLHHERLTGCWNGLYLRVDAEHDRGVWYYPDGSGEPPSWEFEIRAELDEPDVFLSWLEEEVWGVTLPAAQKDELEAALPWARIGRLPPRFASVLVSWYYDSIMRALK